MNEYLNELNEERNSILTDVATALELCDTNSLQPLTTYEHFDDSRPIGYRFVDLSYTVLTADQLDVLCVHIDDQLDVLKNYLHHIQALAVNAHRIEDAKQREIE